MELAVQAGAGVAVVTATGELDVATTPELRRFLHAVLDEQAAPLVVDLTGVQFIDSTGLGVLVSVFKRLSARGQALTLVAPQERLLRIFRLTALDRVFTIVPQLPV